MALRLIEIVVPEGKGHEAEEVLEGRHILGTWRDARDGHLLIQALVPAEEAEPVMDQVEQRFSAVEGFRVVLLPIDASIPRPQSEAPAETPEAPAEEKATHYRISREELYAELADGTKTTPIFVAMTVLSSVVAAVGLLRDDVAVVIGAMVIAPLLSPNVALALATTLGDLRLALEALKANVTGVVIALLVSALLGVLFTVDPHIPAIAARTRVGLGDIALALAAGAAGTLAFTSGLSGAVIGVMVAVALLPPLVTFGLLMGAGYWSQALGALLLLIGNLICVNLAGVSTFLIQGVRPRTWWEAERAKKATFAAMALWVGLLVILAATLLLARLGGR